jgi:preprotein translocase subunit SecG
MYTFIIVLLIIISILLALIVLAQNSKGGGLAAGLSASNQIMGVRKTTDFLEKLTWGLAIGLLVLSMVANFSIPREAGDSSGASMIQEQIDNTAAPAQQQAPTAPVPAPDTTR